MTEQEQCSWSSFIPALAACLVATKGPVLELGIGHFSTPFLHAFCGPTKRKLVSLEKDVDWFRKFDEQFKTQTHEMLWAGGYEFSIPSLAQVKWSVVFIDHSPGGQNRLDAFNAFLPKTKFLVVHDYHRDNEEFIGPSLKDVPYHHVTRTYEPPTLVASMNNLIPESILCL